MAQTIVGILVEGKAVVKGNICFTELIDQEQNQLRNLAQRLGLNLHESDKDCSIATDRTTTGKVWLPIRYKTTAKKRLRTARRDLMKFLRSQGLAVMLCREEIHTNGDKAPCYQHSH